MISDQKSQITDRISLFPISQVSDLYWRQTD